jgi:hypothetical protein
MKGGRRKKRSTTCCEAEREKRRMVGSHCLVIREMVKAGDSRRWKRCKRSWLRGDGGDY